MGSKNKIATQLIRKMLDIKPKAKYFVDLFGGGGSMSFTALQMGLKVTYNEKQTNLVNFIDYILERVKKGQKGKFGLFPDDFYKFITREEFKKLKDEDLIKGQFARICYSFGNNQKGYLFGDIEELKHLGHNIVVFKCKESLKQFNQLTNSHFKLSDATELNNRRLEFMGQFTRQQRDNKEEQLEQLQRLQQLEQLQQLEPLNNLTLLNLDYKDVEINTPEEETIVYLDPPYRGTAKYIEGLNHDELDDYFKSSPYTCFMSEYNAPFESVMEIEKLSLLDNSQEKTKVALEKLYIN